MESQLWNMVVNMTLLFPDCVRRGTLTHTLKNVLPSCGCLTIGRRVFMYVHVRVYSAVDLCHFPQKENTGELYYPTTYTLSATALLPSLSHSLPSLLVLKGTGMK